MRGLLLAAYLIGDAATFIYLTFFDGFEYNAWNWLVAVPLNFVLGAVWPIYWVILKPIMGS